MTFDRTYTRQFSDESTLTPSNLGLSLAAFELGLPTSASINDELPSTFSNYWTAAFGQDTWRLGDLTINAGLRFEYETGVREEDGHMIVGWDPDGDERDHRRRAGGVPGERSAEPGRHAGNAQRRSAGPVYAGDSGVSQPAEAMWMPRASAAYLLGARTVLKGGYGLYYDTLTAADYFAAQAGYSVTTTSTISDDLGRTFKWANAGDRQRELRSVPGSRRRHPLGPDRRRHARRQLGAGRHLDDRERSAASTRGSSAGACRFSASCCRTSRVEVAYTRRASTTDCRSTSAATTCRSSTGTPATRGTPRRTRS